MFTFAKAISLINLSLSGAFSEGATDFLTRMAISSGSLSYLPARQRWMDWHMRIIQRNVLREYWPRIWAARNRGSGPSESGIPPEKSIYSDSGWDTSEPNVRLEKSNYNEGQSSHVSLDVHASVVNTDGQVRNTLSGRKAIDMEYLPENNQRVVDFLEAGTQEDTQRFIGLLEAMIDQEWKARKAVAETRWIPRRPDICTYVERLGINSSFIRQHYELPGRSRDGITLRLLEVQVLTT